MPRNGSSNDPTPFEAHGVFESMGLPPTSDLPPQGHLVLMILGITHESIPCGMLGINILEHSNALDILLSPVAMMASNLAVFAVNITP